MKKSKEYKKKCYSSLMKLTKKDYYGDEKYYEEFKEI